ncbi:type II toxin-antitoxin system RelE/ParE family toxin [Sphingomonas qilianensis]|uniref:Type II toxin-antitoxin system RelE/ParE family toxin n=1 Tax=Sphingomonas qilianensis TaxID=1736690 RepID=A0ABU9XPM1_9SPHN
MLDFPLIGRARPDLHPVVRSIPVKPYVVVYRVIDDTIVIIRVFHAARDVASLDFATD